MVYLPAFGVVLGINVGKYIQDKYHTWMLWEYTTNPNNNARVVLKEIRQPFTTYCSIV